MKPISIIGNESNWPLEIELNKSKPMCKSGSLNISVIHLIVPYPIKKIEETAI